MLMKLRDAGLLALDDEVKSYEPNFYLQNLYQKSTRDITFRNLATHLGGMTSFHMKLCSIKFLSYLGVPDGLPCDFWNCDETTEEMFNRMHSIPTVLPPNTLPGELPNTHLLFIVFMIQIIKCIRIWASLHLEDC